LSAIWYLEGLVDDRASSWRTELASNPFRVGRQADCDLVLSASSISAVHAEFVQQGERMVLRDLGSTNGTFVNLNRLDTPRDLQAGDVVHFADQEFRVFQLAESGSFRTTMALDMDAIQIMRDALRRRGDFEELLRLRQVEVEFQPIVRLSDLTRVGYEVLGRGARGGFPRKAPELFAAAESLGMEWDLSAVLREKSVEEARNLPGTGLLFLNTHPREIDEPERLMESLRECKKRVGDAQLVLEIHEMAVTDVDAFRALREELTDAGVQIAFDDFGKGRSRFVELAELQPQFLKFDRLLVQDLHRATKQRWEMVRVIVDLVWEMGVVPLAEGVESEGEAEACEEIGFQLGQGYFYGRPTTPALLLRGS
jgi:EAL domain-containing protein (putative c-di-GMP-specific phosphodiesterase class I)